MAKGECTGRASGIEIRVLTNYSDGKDAKFAKIVGAAIGVIDRADPKTLKRIRQNLRGILVCEYAFGSKGLYNHSSQLCVLHPDYLDRDPEPEAVSLTLVHESMHAKISTMGISYKRFPHRIERLCMSAEIAFAKKLSSNRNLIPGVRSRYIHVFEDYNPQEKIKDEMRSLERWKVPSLAKKPLRWILRRRLKRAQSKMEAAERITHSA